MTLKRCLTKFQILSGATLSSNYKINSSKVLTQTNAAFNNVLKLKTLGFSKKMLQTLIVKSSKKLKTKFQNISIVWKICTTTFNFDELGTMADLCLII